RARARSFATGAVPRARPARPRRPRPTPRAPTRCASSRLCAGTARRSTPCTGSARARGRFQEWTLVPSPHPAVLPQELFRGRRPPRASGVVRERGPVAPPGRDDRVDERPLLLDLVRPREHPRVAEEAVEQQALVRLRDPGAEGAAVEEVHV